MKNSFSDKQKFRFGLANHVKRFHFCNFSNKATIKTFSLLPSIFLARISPVRRLHKLGLAFIIFGQTKMSINQASLVRENSHHEIY